MTGYGKKYANVDELIEDLLSCEEDECDSILEDIESDDPYLRDLFERMKDCHSKINWRYRLVENSKGLNKKEYQNYRTNIQVYNGYKYVLDIYAMGKSFPSKSPEQKLIDFYFLLLARGKFSKFEEIYPTLYFEIDEFLKEVVYELKKIILDSLYLGICAEVCHVERIKKRPEQKICKYLDNKKKFQCNVDIYSYKLEESISKLITMDMRNEEISSKKFIKLREVVKDASDWKYNERKRILNRLFSDRASVVEFAKIVFRFGNMGESYGGVPWLMVAQAYSELSESTEINNIIEKIDMTLSLEHNTSTVFNKDDSFFRGSRRGHMWITDLLDFKATANNLKDYSVIVTPGLRKLANRVNNIVKRMGS